jgi:hypothetical protein
LIHEFAPELISWAWLARIPLYQNSNGWICWGKPPTKDQNAVGSHDILTLDSKFPAIIYTPDEAENYDFFIGIEGMQRMGVVNSVDELKELLVTHCNLSSYQLD